MIEGALFESGRPVIVVPYIQKQGLTLERVDGVLGRRPHRGARDRRRDAVPHARQGGRGRGRDRAAQELGEITDTHMAEHLVRHGVPAVSRASPAAISTCRARSSRTRPTTAPISS